MELQYFGGNCVKITTKKVSIVIDDNLKELGGSPIAKPADIILNTLQTKNKPQAVLFVDTPGEYESSDVSIQGIPARSHIDEEGTNNTTMYRIEVNDIRIAVVGHIYPDLTEEQLEMLGVVDILLVPVGGHGFTLDPVGALKVIKEITPKIIIPTYYADAKLQYPVPAISKEEAIKGLLMEPTEVTAKLKFKGNEHFSDQAQLIILERS